MRIHLDTDLGGDPDDVCALAMLLGCPDVELVGITTTIDAVGLRAAYVRHCLRLVGRDDIPVAAGAGVSLTTGQIADPVVNDARFWPNDLEPSAAAPDAALDLLARGIESGATVVAIGPLTNLALLAVLRAGSLKSLPVVIMGGWVTPPADGLPRWGPEVDWNVQWDPRAVEIVAGGVRDLTLATLPATLKAHLRAGHVLPLRASGPLGDLIAGQSEAHAGILEMRRLGRVHAGLPDDLLNFHYDPVACAAALGWPEVAVETMPLRPVLEGELFRFIPDPAGQPTRVVVDVDGEGFSERWLAAVEAAQQ
jgi:inosine-uridine nucleoside N-ribohydrolase